MMVMFMPDALHHLLGLDPSTLTDRMVDSLKSLHNNMRS